MNTTDATASLVSRNKDDDSLENVAGRTSFNYMYMTF
jgi:hypothetical protein